jgi:uncharacterized protein (TIGR03437 family)
MEPVRMFNANRSPVCKVLLGLLAMSACAAAAAPAGDPDVAIVKHTCTRMGLPANCNAGGPTAIVLRSNTEVVASHALTNFATAATDNGFASLSAASYQGAPLAVGSIAAGWGTNLATKTQAAESLPLPTSLAGTTVTITDSIGNTMLAPLFYVSPSQINYQIPEAAKPGEATVRVVSGDGTVSTGSLTLEMVAPGLISANASGQDVAAAYMVRVKPDGAQTSSLIFQYDSQQSKFVPSPIDPAPETDQIILTLYGTGFEFRSDLSAVKVLIDGVDCEVLYAGPQGGYVGLDQLNVRLPYMLGGRGEMEIELTVDGQAANVVTVATGGPMIMPPPAIAALSPNSALPGQTVGTLTITGQHLDGVSALEFLPATGITVSGLAVTSTVVTAQVTVAADALTGTRQVAVLSPKGRSNRMPFTIASAGPRITAISPDSAHLGDTLSLTITGDNLSGVTGVQFMPDAGIAVSNVTPSSSMVSLQITIAPNAFAGERLVSVISPSGASNTLSFTIGVAAPQITSLSPAEGTAGQVISSFVISGQNLTGVTSIIFSPPTGITVGPITATASTVSAQVTIDSSAPIQMRSVSVVSPAGLSNSLAFTILQPGPQITSLSPASGQPGQTIAALTISGQNLAGVTAITFSPSTGITVSGLHATATAVTAQVVIAADAATGARTISVVSPGGVSNTLTFTVETATPQISSLNPNNGDPGQTISSFTINGQNLTGVTAVNFSSSSGITVSDISATATRVTAQVAIASNAATGARAVTVVSPAGSSNSLTFTVNKPLSPIPVISNVVLNSPQPAGPVVTVSGSFNFTDGDKDIVYSGSESSSAKLKMSVTMGTMFSCTTSTYGSFLNKAGQSSGTITFSITMGWSSQLTGSFTVDVSLIDAAGHQSNVVSVHVTNWYCELRRPQQAGAAAEWAVIPRRRDTTA